MKTCLKTALAIFLIVSSTYINAQVKTGYVIGFNLSTMTLNTMGRNYDPSTLLSVHFGGIFEIPLIDNLALRSGALFSAKGSVYETDTADFIISPIYIDIPVNAIYSIGSGALRISLIAGSYFACGVSGYKIEPSGVLKDLNFGSGQNDDLKTFDIGFCLGGSINIKSLMISVQYESGLSNLVPVKTEDSEIKNKVIAISLSISFAVKN